MARKSTGKTGKHSGARPSATSTRSKKEDNKSSQGSSSPHRGEKVVSISSGRRESSRRERSSGASRSAPAHALTDHDEIRQWAQDRGAHPASVRGTGDPEDIRGSVSFCPALMLHRTEN